MSSQFCAMGAAHPTRRVTHPRGFPGQASMANPLLSARPTPPKDQISAVCWHIMKRTTVKIPDELDRRLRQEAERRGTTISEVTREALEAKLGVGRPLLMAAAGSFDSGRSDLSERVEEILTSEAEQFRS